MKLLESLLLLLSPLSCSLCHKGGNPLCKECIDMLPACVTMPEEDAAVLLSYRDTRVKKILRDAKYHHERRLYRPLIRTLVQKYPFLLSLKQSETIIIPIPTHTLRVLFRGQDHTKALAVFLSKETGVPYATSLLVKKKRTRRQALLSKSERLIAQKDSFTVNEKKRRLLEKKRVLLIDDIMTTGSTMTEAKKILLTAGANEVHLVALAH